MKKLLILGIILSYSYSSVYSEEITFIPLKEVADVDIGMDVDVGDDDEQVIWDGPGLYYTVWFDNEYDYNDWYGHHY
jgi:hypothetical protein